MSLCTSSSSRVRARKRALEAFRTVIFFGRLACSYAQNYSLLLCAPKIKVLTFAVRGLVRSCVRFNVMYKSRTFQQDRSSQFGKLKRKKEKKRTTKMKVAVLTFDGQFNNQPVNNQR